MLSMRSRRANFGVVPIRSDMRERREGTIVRVCADRHLSEGGCIRKGVADPIEGQEQV
jgi:hypothetical protein